MAIPRKRDRSYAVRLYRGEAYHTTVGVHYHRTPQGARFCADHINASWPGFRANTEPRTERTYARNARRRGR